jgi:hypothetical protein
VGSHGSAVHVPFEFGGQRPRLPVGNPTHMLVPGASSCSPVLPVARQPTNYIHSQPDFEARVAHEHAQENERDRDEDFVAALPSADAGNATTDDGPPALQVTEELGNFVLSLQGGLMSEEKINTLLRLTQHRSYDKELTRNAFPNLRTLKKTPPGAGR